MTHPFFFHQLRLCCLGGLLGLMSACAPSASNPADMGNPSISGSITTHMTSSITPTQPGIPLDTEWTLLELLGKAASGDQRPTLSWEADGRIHGSAGCNRYFGEWSGTAQQLRLNTMGMTKMFCIGEATDQENAFVKAISAVRRLQLDGPTLVLQDDAGKPLLRFERSGG